MRVQGHCGYPLTHDLQGTHYSWGSLSDQQLCTMMKFRKRPWLSCERQSWFYWHLRELPMSSLHRSQSFIYSLTTPGKCSISAKATKNLTKGDKVNHPVTGLIASSFGDPSNVPHHIQLPSSYLCHPISLLVCWGEWLWLRMTGIQVGLEPCVPTVLST